MNIKDKFNTTSVMVRLGADELVAIETIKKCKHSGNYTEIWFWEENLDRSIWDEHCTIWNNIIKANDIVWQNKRLC